MPTTNRTPEDLRAYRRYGLTLMQLMGLLIVVGVAVHLTVKYFA